MSLPPATPDTAESPESPPSPSLAPPAKSTRLFAPIPSSSPSPEDSSPSPSPTPGPETPPSWTDAPDAPSSGPGEPGDTPSTGSAVKLSKAGLRAALGTGFKQACRVLAGFVAIEEERALGVWVPDEEDVADVSRPATNIVYRRLPDEAKGGDVIDLFALGLAVAAYLGKNLQRRAMVRTHLRLQAEQGIAVEQPETMPTFPGGGF
jgi:hypothetical protein